MLPPVAVAVSWVRSRLLAAAVLAATGLALLAFHHPAAPPPAAPPRAADDCGLILDGDYVRRPGEPQPSRAGATVRVVAGPAYYPRCRAASTETPPRGRISQPPPDLTR